MKVLESENILIMALLRIGDVFMLSSAIKQVRQNNPKAHISILINDNFSHMSSIIPFVDAVELFPRALLQKALTNKNESIFSAFDVLEDFIDNKRGKYTEVINLTHNKMSAYLIENLDVDSVQGMFSFGGKLGILGEGFKQLNSKSTFHYVDEFKYAVSVDDNNVGQLSINEKAIEEFATTKPIIALQMFTSDKKKNWNSGAWQKLVNALKRENPNHRMIALAAPNEVELVSEVSGVELYSCSLKQAAGLLQKSEILISVDTSIKHIAVALNVPVLEICLGSSDYLKTGSYSENSLIVSPIIDCHPCSHVSKCKKASFECGDKLLPGVVLEAVRVLLGASSLEVFNKKYNQVAKVAMPFMSEFGFIHFNSTVGDNESVSSYFEKVSTLFINKKEDEKPVPPYSTYSLMVLKELNKQYLNVDLNYLTESIDFADKQALKVCKKIIKGILRIKMEKNNGQLRIL